MSAPHKTRWFHGDVADRQRFEDQRWERDSSVQGSPLQEGPGLYFTDSVREALGYGPYLYEGLLKQAFRLMPKRKPTMKFLGELYYMASEDDKQRFLENFDTNSPAKALSNYLHYDDFHYAAVILHGDLFSSVHDWIKAVQFAGFDGVVYDRENSRHLITWSPDKMRIWQTFEEDS